MIYIINKTEDDEGRLDPGAVPGASTINTLELYMFLKILSKFKWFTDWEKRIEERRVKYLGL